MLLAVDVGNTNIVAGLFAGSEVVAHWRIATDRNRMADEYGMLLRDLVERAGLSADDVDAGVLASVVPPVRTAICQAIRSYFGLEVLVVSPSLDLGIDVRYSPPHGVGADRIANAVAVVKCYGAPAVVVDFGTSTNFDVVSPDGAYVGGAIAVGIELSLEALYGRTAQLPNIALEAPRTAIGTSTVESMQSGIIYGYAGLVDGLVRRITAELGTSPHVVATGGLAGIVAPYAETVEAVDPDLTLVGLRLIYERNSRHKAVSGARQDQSLT